jgi:hypothetical protein
MWLAQLVMLAVVASAAATLIVPMRDEDLVATSDVVVVGTVEGIESVLLGSDRVMTRISIAVEQAVKGDPGAPSVVVTEAGGEVAGIRGVVFDGPSYTLGERAMVFLRARPDGSLVTNALALGKYAVLAASDGTAMARRETPTVDARPLDALVGRVAALSGGRGARNDGRFGVGIEPPTFSWTVGAFNLSTNTQGIGARWFEADCNIPVLYDRAGADAAFDDAASGAALAAAAAAWTDVDTASIIVMPNAVVPATPSGIGGTLDGHNTVMFGDPFSEVPDLVNCTGVLAMGGIFSAYSAAIPELGRVVNGQTFGKGFEGDIVLNPEVGSCLGDPLGLDEVVAHEIGHTLGFAHSSEDPNETDPVKKDALMYFTAHNDGRGASVRQDDVAAATFSYPADLAATTKLGAVACEVNLGILNPACTGPIVVTPLKKIANAGKAATSAANAKTTGKQKKLFKKTLRLLTASDKAVTKFVQGACATGMHSRIQTYKTDVKATIASL